MRRTIVALRSVLVQPDAAAAENEAGAAASRAGL